MKKSENIQNLAIIHKWVGIKKLSQRQRKYLRFINKRTLRLPPIAALRGNRFSPNGKWRPRVRRAFVAVIGCFADLVLGGYCGRWQGGGSWCRMEAWVCVSLPFVRSLVMFSRRNFQWAPISRGSRCCGLLPLSSGGGLCLADWLPVGGSSCCWWQRLLCFCGGSD